MIIGYRIRSVFIPIYQYEHPETGEIFEEIRLISNRDKKYKAPDGIICPRLKIPKNMGYCGRSEKEREVFELDPDYARRVKPKYVKFRDGHRERYDPGRHC